MIYQTISAPLLAVCALGILPLTGASTVLTFSDDSCRTLSRSISVEDSTGSGECTKITKGYSSFMVGTLGDGCLSMLRTSWMYATSITNNIVSSNDIWQ